MTFKEQIQEMRAFLRNDPNAKMDASQFGEAIVNILEKMELRQQALEREIGPSSAFIDMDDANNCLR